MKPYLVDIPALFYYDVSCANKDRIRNVLTVGGWTILSSLYPKPTLIIYIKRATETFKILHEMTHTFNDTKLYLTDNIEVMEYCGKKSVKTVDKVNSELFQSVTKNYSIMYDLEYLKGIELTGGLNPYLMLMFRVKECDFQTKKITVNFFPETIENSYIPLRIA